MTVEKKILIYTSHDTSRPGGRTDNTQKGLHKYSAECLNSCSTPATINQQFFSLDWQKSLTLIISAATKCGGHFVVNPLNREVHMPFRQGSVVWGRFPEEGPPAQGSSLQ